MFVFTRWDASVSCVLVPYIAVRNSFCVVGVVVVSILVRMQVQSGHLICQDFCPTRFSDP